MSYAVVKSLHIIFVTSWFAGLFYLPRIFVNMAMVTDDNTQKHLQLMATKLFRFMMPLSTLTIVFGAWLWFGFHIQGGWLHAKLLLVLGLIGYHHWCGRILRQFIDGKNTRSHNWYRFFNEVPVIALVIIVLLVVVKPF
ncbi:CopD family protein [Leeia sp. TBRC 13508]|uniref:Protoporphyrinogen IX oxidase n=1 Tax=Leeia speluncae TaxID=2884804 RepID=A0ABS8D3I3_9NEIS|nr:CopD family protein [Leeia speluncae]MCB6182732.1 CopD family protein [Leeia speluncae]